MDFVNMAKQGYEAYAGNSGDSGNTSSGQGFDLRSVLGMAKSEHGDESQHSYLEKAVGMLNDKQGEMNGHVDEEGSVQAHNKVFEEGDTKGASPQEHGTAYAMSLFKKHFAGGENQTNEKDSDLLGKVIVEAKKLADEHFSHGSSDDKQSAVDSAAMTFGKLVIKSKMSGGTIGGSDSGGLSSLASKFL
ncbi:hypothetical protein E3P98_02532 [Wallemia ichthyophaga]|nr:hypothetical protein E3P98_02532 [Wallemia ichthyophaga]